MISKPLALVSLIVSLIMVAFGLTGPMTALAATTPSLGAAASYGILASTYTNTSAATTINGDIGFSVGPATPPAGTHANYGSGSPYTTAGTDQASALSVLAAEGCTYTWGAAVDLSTDPDHGTVGVYTPGVYCSMGAMAVTGPLTLSGSGTFIFRAVGALDTTAGSIITLSGASACDIFWTPTGAATLGATSTFEGTVIGAPAITVGANTDWTGRALNYTGDVTTGATSTITVPDCTPAPATLHVIKHVLNNNSGTADASDFNLYVKLAGTNVAGSPTAGVEAPGTTYSLAAGTYVVSEDADVGYDQSFSDDCDSGGSITLAPGDDLTCTITNDDIPVIPPPPDGTINVVKIVTNDSGGSKSVGDFSLFVNGTPVTSGDTNSFPVPDSYTVTETGTSGYTGTFTGDCDADGHVDLVASDIKFCIITNNDNSEPVVVPPVPPLIDVVKIPSPLSLPAGPGPVTYTYTLQNLGTVPATDITMVGDSCSPIILDSGDSNSNDELDVDETWVYSCSMTLTETHTNTVVATGMANGLTATDISSSTVVVGLALDPPLIHVTKIPNHLTRLAGGGPITYTETLTNPGTVALSSISLTDDKCDPVDYVSGDDNSDSSLDTDEAWIYTCQTDLSSTITNIATASGDANGLTARDIAIATVVVAQPGDSSDATTLPKLPNTGVNPVDTTAEQSLPMSLDQTIT